MAKPAREPKADDPRDKILKYFKKRSGFVAKGSTEMQIIVRQQCSAAGIGVSDGEMATMAAGLATYRHADYIQKPPPPKPDGD